jgi:hypothetical protein
MSIDVSIIIDYMISKDDSSLIPSIAETGCRMDVLLRNAINGNAFSVAETIITKGYLRITFLARIIVEKIIDKGTKDMIAWLSKIQGYNSYLLREDVLIYAIKKDKCEIVHMLLDLGSRITPNVINTACKSGSSVIIEELLIRGISLNAKDLTEMIINGHITLALALFDKVNGNFDDESVRSLMDKGYPIAIDHVRETGKMQISDDLAQELLSRGYNPGFAT